MTFLIYANLAEDVKKRLDRIAAKAARYSVPFVYSIGDEHPETVRVYEIDHVNGVQYETARHTVAAVTVEVECEDFIRANGWTVRAKVEHGDKGNIVTALGNKPAEPAWFKAPAHCDHCKTNRFRKVTYFVEHETGEVRQVGRACLHEYTGINPATAAMWAEVKDILGDGLDRMAGEWSACTYEEMYPVTLILAHAYDEIKAHGYRKTDEPRNTRDEVKERVLNGSKPSSEAMENAEKVSAWLIGLDQVTGDRWIGDLERNGSMLALSGYAKAKHFGRLVYMPIAYERYLEHKARDAQREAAWQAETVSQHVGEVGQRITLTAATAKLLTSWEGAYGTTYLYKFTDAQGNVYIWYASRGIETRDGMTLKGTVKDHNERDGVKQTVLTRCKAA